ncbi:MAG TPA: O-antigen ligase family protein [Gaiellaceae bacterium]|nr:O-antigen ligase family protein [Gaiellaceae bacterium]
MGGAALVAVAVVRPEYGLAAALMLAPLTNFQLHAVGGAFAKPFHIVLPLIAFSILAYGVILGDGVRLRSVWSAPAAVAVFVVVGLISAMHALQPSQSVTKLFLLISAVGLFFAVLQVGTDARRLKVIVGGAILGLLIAAAQGLEQRYAGLPGAIGFVTNGRFVARAQGSFGHPNDYGGYLAFVLPLAAGVAFSRAFSGRLRALALSATLVALPALAFSYARGAMLALSTASLAWLAFARPRLALVAAGAAAVLLFVFAPAALRDRFDPKATQQDVPLRADIWGSAVDIYSGHPALGVGVGNFPVAYAALPSTLAHASQRRLLNQHGLLVPPHAQNLYLNVLAEEGILGVGALTLLALAIIRAVAGGIRARAPDARVVAGALGTSFVTVALHSVLDVTLLSELAFPFFGLLAVCVAFVSLDREEPATS